MNGLLEISASVFATSLAETRKAKSCNDGLIAAIQEKYPRAEKIQIEKRVAHNLAGRWDEFICNPPIKQQTKDWLYWVNPVTKTLYFRDDLSATVKPGHVQVSGYEGADLSCLVDLLQALNWWDSKILISGAEEFQRGMAKEMKVNGMTGIPASKKIQAEIEKKGRTGGTGGGQESLPKPDGGDLESLNTDELLQLSQEAADDGDIETIEDIQDELRKRQEARASPG